MFLCDWRILQQPYVASKLSTAREHPRQPRPRKPRANILGHIAKPPHKDIISRKYKHGQMRWEMLWCSFHPGERSTCRAPGRGKLPFASGGVEFWLLDGSEQRWATGKPSSMTCFFAKVRYRWLFQWPRSLCRDAVSRHAVFQGRPGTETRTQQSNDYHGLNNRATSLPHAIGSALTPEGLASARQAATECA